MPESGKTTLKASLTSELVHVLAQRPDPRVVTIADGSNDNWKCSTTTCAFWAMLYGCKRTQPMMLFTTALRLTIDHLCEGPTDTTGTARSAEPVLLAAIP